MRVGSILFYFFYFFIFFFNLKKVYRRPIFFEGIEGGEGKGDCHSLASSSYIETFKMNKASSILRMGAALYVPKSQFSRPSFLLQ